jgi:hypothetical protein
MVLWFLAQLPRNKVFLQNLWVIKRAMFRPRLSRSARPHRALGRPRGLIAGPLEPPLAFLWCSGGLPVRYVRSFGNADRVRLLFAALLLLIPGVTWVEGGWISFLVL